MTCYCYDIIQRMRTTKRRYIGGTVVEKWDIFSHSGFAESLKRMEEARTAFQSAPEERSISAMPVVVHYVARIGDVRLTKRGDEYIFKINRTLSDGEGRERSIEVQQNAFEIRDEFLKLKTPSEALDFLTNTGQFSPLDFTLRWSELQRWQRFTYLVQEHVQLARAMDEGLRVGECAEALKALSGSYDSAFFDLEDPKSAVADRFWREEQVRRHPELTEYVREGERINAERKRQVGSWFRQPAGNACSIEWIPKTLQPDDDELARKLQAGGAMIEYLVPRDNLRPVFLIRPAYSLEAIAASVFADRANGVEYRSCKYCEELFLVGSHKNKLYCSKARCKNTAHQKRKRENARETKGG
jgi:hypothetical protein